MDDAPDILYLDFDGVLHPESVFIDAHRGIHLRGAFGRRLFENARVLIDELEPYPSLRLVLSTSWVRVLGYDRARGRLPHELQQRCIGATFHSRHHRTGKEDGVRPFPTALRGEEVLADVGRRRPRRWLAVDDTDEGWPQDARNNLILTHPFSGISASGVLERLHLALRRFS
ncbi:HAD domain-containing protein [Piscinibacter gummiphilus]|uniref:HAD domain-containing protein n=1 Tax=Piscinibacter gummiphilus TaxID=946333 RepID=UPI000C1B0029|nr:HAD domain-containing protein [Piscinibacter gummiphilus]ATU63322.1 hypothetical protein CPZ87_01480 [Piscinibacter gummiphilus]